MSHNATYMISKKLVLGQAWWLTPIIPALSEAKAEGLLEASLGNIKRPCLYKQF